MVSELFPKLVVTAQNMIVMLIKDGLGGLSREPRGKTELETAHTPNKDALTGRLTLGLTIPVTPGITPGSGPGHLALFGYNPIQNDIGRGAREVLGVDFKLKVQDQAARGNFCNVDSEGVITDWCASQIPTSICRELPALLETIQVDRAQVFIRPIKEHRFVFIIRSPELNASLTDTDPQITGVHPLPVRVLDRSVGKSANLVNQFLSKSKMILAPYYPANVILLRGFACLSTLLFFMEKYTLNEAAVANHGMYRGVARMVGMHVLKVDGKNLEDKPTCLEKYWPDYDFFYLHIKKSDSYGEMGDFDMKDGAIEGLDALIPRLLSLQTDVVIFNGDYSSPAILKSHSWHPVRIMIYSHYVRADGFVDFGETAGKCGSLGLIRAMHIMMRTLANTSRLAKYGE